MEFRVLGPLDVRRGMASATLGAERLRSVLALLLLEANHVVSTDRLVDDLWDGAPPDGARTSLRTYVSQIRKALRAVEADVRVVTQPPGYLVLVEPGELDLDRFEATVAEGRANLALERFEDAAAQLRAGLELWRGPALADVTSVGCLQAAAARMEQRRLAAVEDRIEADLALGHHSAVVDELEALTASHPMRERLWQHRMLALYRCGRQAESLRAYQDIRAHLADTLGLEPSVELRHLETAVLQQDPGLDPPTARHTPRQPPPVRAPDGANRAPTGTPFVGRAAELAELEQLWAEAIDGHRRVALVTGEPGVGKTSLCAAFVAELAPDAAHVIRLRCPREPLVPFHPLVEALQAGADRLDMADLRRRLGPAGSSLARLVPELDDGTLPTPGTGDPESERYRLFHSVSELIREAAKERPTVIQFDDLHWADRPTLLLLDHVVRAAADAALLIVGTYRDTELTPEHPLVGILAGWRADRIGHRIPLQGLSVGEVAALVDETLGAGAGTRDLADRLHTDTDGNAFFLRELLDHIHQHCLDTGTEPGTVDLATTGMPESLREAILHRLRGVSEACRRCLEVGAVVGAEFDADVVQEAADLDDAELLEALEQASAERLVLEDAGTVGRYGFAHALVREVVYDGLSRIRRTQLHRRIASALEQPGRPPALAALAFHYREAARGGRDVDAAMRYALLAGRQAIDQLAHEQAVDVLEQALDLEQEPSDARRELRCDLLMELGLARERSGGVVDGRAAFTRVLAMSREAGDAIRMARAALGLAAAPGGYAITVRPSVDLVLLLEEALAVLPHDEGALRARLLGRLAVELYYSSETDRRRELADEAVGLARTLDDPAVLLDALSCRAWATVGVDVPPQRRLAQADEVLDLAREAGDGLVAYRTHFLRQQTLLEVGDLVAADAAGEEAARLAEELRRPGFLPWVVAYRAMRSWLSGDHERADEQASAALDQGLAAGGDPEVMMALLGGQLILLRLFRGGLESYEAPLLAMRDDLDGHPAVLCWIAVFYCEMQQTGPGNAALDHAMEGFDSMAHDGTWLVSMWGLAYAAAFLGRADVAQRLHPALEPYADRWCATTSTIFLGPVTLLLGMLARTTGDHEQAARHLHSALEATEAVGAMTVAALVRSEQALLALAVRDPGAAAVLADAEDRADHLGLHVLGARLRSLRGALAPASG